MPSGYRTPPNKVALVITMYAEGQQIRHIGRVLGIHEQTVLGVLRRAGAHTEKRPAKMAHDKRVRVMELLQRSWSHKAIARELDISLRSVESVARIVNKGRIRPPPRDQRIYVSFTQAQIDEIDARRGKLGRQVYIRERIFAK